MALHNYHDTNLILPVGAGIANGLSWRVYVLPYVEQQALYQRFDFGAGAWNGPPNHEGPNKMVHALNRIPNFNCPSVPKIIASNGSSMLDDGRKTYTSDYHGVAGPLGVNPTTGADYLWEPNPVGQGGFALQGVLGRDSKIRFADIRDGMSNTFAIGEVAVKWNGTVLESDGADWVRGVGFGTGMAGCRNIQYAINTPYNNVFNNISFSSLHSGGGAQFAMCDGSVRFVQESVDLILYKATASRDGGEPRIVD